MNLHLAKLILRPLIFSAFALCSLAQGQTFVKILGGPFTMGDPNGVGFTSETQRVATLNTFFIATTEVTFNEWKTVYTWALTKGYTFDSPGRGKGSGHPVHSVSWHDVTKWCNAKSEMKGRVPCYRLGADVYKTGRSIPYCDWKANGYRLPTEAEWEKAARAGQSGKNFPWDNNITHAHANYFSDSSRFTFDTSPTSGYHALYKVGKLPYTNPVTSFPSYGGLKGMAGNVDEWCWDRFGNYPSTPVTNPRGASAGKYRVYRGGSWATYATFCRVSYRNIIAPNGAYNTLGFRIARSF